MSTKAIREALGAAAMAAPDTNNEELARKVAAAWPAVEAIERAAKALTTELPARAYVARHSEVEHEMAEAMKLLESIAKDAPWSSG